MLQLLYLWAVGLLLILSLLYLWVRLRLRRQRGATAVAADPFARLITWLTGQWRALTGAGSLLPVAATVEMVREPVAALLLTGLLLVWLGQASYRDVPTPGRWWVLGLMGVGLLLFTLGGRTAVWRYVPPRWHWLGSRLSRYLDVRPWQLLLLAIAPLFGLLASLVAGDRLQAHNGLVATAAWLASGALVIAGAAKRSPVAQRTVLSRPEMVFTLVLFAVALLLRGSATDVLPTTFSGDEGSAGLVAAMFWRGEANNPFVSGWFSFPSLYFAVQSLGLYVWGQTVVALRLVSALIGALTVIVVYLLARSLFDRQTAVFASIYLTFSHYHMHISRIGLNNIWDGLFGAIAIYGFWDGWKTGRRSSYVWCGVALGVGVYFYVSIRVLPILFLLWSLAALWRSRAQFWQRLPGMMLAAWVAVVVALPLGLFFYSYPMEFNAPLERVSIFGEWLDGVMATQGKTAVAVVAEQAWRAVGGFTQQPLRLLYDPGAPLLLTGAAALFLIGIAWGISHFDLRYLLLLLPLVAAVVSNAISQDSPASQRYILAMPLVAVWLAVPLGGIAGWLGSFWPRYRWLGMAAAAGIITAVVVQDVRYYFFDVYGNYVLGGINTLVATDIASYLSQQKPAEQDVYFFGFPRMGYYSLSTIPYLVPQMHGQDIVEPLTSAPTFAVTGPTLFVFLPERMNELDYVRQVYGDGRLESFQLENGEPLFTVYHVLP